jgi:hypothetical protein
MAAGENEPIQRLSLQGQHAAPLLLLPSRERPLTMDAFPATMQWMGARIWRSMAVELPATKARHLQLATRRLETRICRGTVCPRLLSSIRSILELASGFPVLWQSLVHRASAVASLQQLQGRLNEAACAGCCSRGCRR